MNRQRVFDRIANHLLKQGRKSGHPVTYNNEQGLETEFECQYRTYDSEAKKVLKCAIGCLIPFRNYDPAFEGGNVFAQRVQRALPKSLRIYASSDLKFLVELQQIHDTKEPGSWPFELRNFAHDHHLNADIVTNWETTNA